MFHCHAQTITKIVLAYVRRSLEQSPGDLGGAEPLRQFKRLIKRDV